MLACASAVLLAIVALALLLVADYERSEERVEALRPYLPPVSAVVLVGMGIGLVAGFF